MAPTSCGVGGWQTVRLRHLKAVPEPRGENRSFPENSFFPASRSCARKNPCLGNQAPTHPKGKFPGNLPYFFSCGMVRDTHMPLPEVNTRYPYKAMMFTFGPLRPDVTREQVQQRASNLLGENLKANCIAFETSSTGYYHCHLAVDLKKPAKPPMRLIKEAKSFCHTDDQGRKPNCGTHYVPTRDAAGKPAYDVLKKYLQDPTKIKWTDEGALELIATPFQMGDWPGMPSSVSELEFDSKQYRQKFQAWLTKCFTAVRNDDVQRCIERDSHLRMFAIRKERTTHQVPRFPKNPPK